MKTLLISFLCVLAWCTSWSQSTPRKNDPGLPKLYKIQRVTLTPSYSCRSREESRKGYGTTALFLSTYSRERNSPEVLFNGACDSPDRFLGQTAGDDLDLVADYGEVPLESLTLHLAFSPQDRADSLATFKSSAKVTKGHTYGLVINKGDIRGFLYFRVSDHVPNQKVDLEYVVMDYELMSTQARSAGFAWEKTGKR